MGPKTRSQRTPPSRTSKMDPRFRRNTPSPAMKNADDWPPLVRETGKMGKKASSSMKEHISAVSSAFESDLDDLKDFDDLYESSESSVSNNTSDEDYEPEMVTDLTKGRQHDEMMKKSNDAQAVNVMRALDKSTKTDSGLNLDSDLMLDKDLSVAGNVLSEAAPASTPVKSAAAACMNVAVPSKNPSILGNITSNESNHVAEIRRENADAFADVITENPSGSKSGPPTGPHPIGLRHPKELGCFGGSSEQMKVGLNILNSPAIGIRNGVGSPGNFSTGPGTSPDGLDMEDPFLLNETIKATEPNFNKRSGGPESMTEAHKYGPISTPAGPNITEHNSMVGTQQALNNESGGNDSSIEVMQDKIFVPNPTHPIFGTYDPMKLTSFTFKCSNDLKFEDGPECDPIRGAKHWNHTLFSQFIAGGEVKDSETRLCYAPPSKDDQGEWVVDLNGHFMTKSIKAHRLQLIGYFVGGGLSYQVVRGHLIKMWRRYGIKSIIKKTGGLYFFQFESDEGMCQVLDRNPWLVEGQQLVLKLWEPDMLVSKPNFRLVPIWVTIKDLPMCLWNGGNLGQIVSVLGKPLMLDKTTFERCESKKGPLSYARVLVEADATRELTSRVKVKFPPRHDLPSKIEYLELGYKWTPPRCSLCCLFGHSDEFHVNKHPAQNVQQDQPAQPELAQQPEKRRAIGPSTVVTVDINKKAQQSNDSSQAHNIGSRTTYQRNTQDVDFIPVVSRKNRKKGEGFGPNNVSYGQQKGQQWIVKAGQKAAAVGQPEAHKNDLKIAAVDHGQAQQQDGPPPLPRMLQVDQPAPVVRPKFKFFNFEYGFGKNGDDVLKPSNATNEGGIILSNKFASLGDEIEDDCYDGEIGLWDSQRMIAHSYYDNKSTPNDVDFEKWPDELKKYYKGLVKAKGKMDEVLSLEAQHDTQLVLVEEEEDEVESDMEEGAQEQKI